MSLHGLEDTLQSAYRAGHSTDTALFKIKSDSHSALDDGEGILLTLIALSSAFDTICHKILLSRLQSVLGLEGTALRWIESYLHNRSQTVCVGQEQSCPSELATGVPQGSVLGPLLFLIYILPLRRIIDNFQVQRHGYADDTQLYMRFSLMDLAAVGESLSVLESCLEQVRLWMRTNKLKLNDSKTEFMVISPSYYRHKLALDKLVLHIGDEIIKQSDFVRN